VGEVGWLQGLVARDAMEFESRREPARKEDATTANDSPPSAVRFLDGTAS